MPGAQALAGHVVAAAVDLAHADGRLVDTSRGSWLSPVLLTAVVQRAEPATADRFGTITDAALAAGVGGADGGGAWVTGAAEPGVVRHAQAAGAGVAGAAGDGACAVLSLQDVVRSPEVSAVLDPPVMERAPAADHRRPVAPLDRACSVATLALCRLVSRRHVTRAVGGVGPSARPRSRVAGRALRWPVGCRRRLPPRE